MKTSACYMILVFNILSVTSAGEQLRISASGWDSGDCPHTSAMVCPRGDYGFVHVYVSDILGSEEDTATVYCTAASGKVCFCAGESPQSAPLTAHEAEFRFQRMGGCDSVTFWVISSDGTSDGPTDPIFVAGPDINGDCAVSAIDLALFAMDYGHQGRPCSDFDCDGAIDAIDLSLFARAYGHMCLP